MSTTGAKMENIGLTTEEAFERLFQDLNNKLDAYHLEKGRNWQEILRSSFSTKSHHAIITWCSFAVLAIESFIILILFIANFGQTWTNLIPEAILMIVIGAFNVYLVIWENYKRINELPVKIQAALINIKEAVADVKWKEENYPNLYMPFSPCITMQWCYRNKTLVNLPWALLVPGDLILLQPSQKIIAKCQMLHNEEVLSAGGYYTVKDKNSMERNEGNINRPRFHVPLQSRLAVVVESPFLDMVDIMLNEYGKSPSTFYNKERHNIVSRLVECILLPTSLMVFVIICMIRMFNLPNWLGVRVAPMSELLLLQPMTYTYPLIPLSLPIIWVILHSIGNAKIHTFFNLRTKSLLKTEKSYEEKCSEEDTSTETIDLNFKSLYTEIWKYFRGKEETLHRSQNLLHVLASVTALCCVDKKGILSWANPTAEKIFFLKSDVDPKTKRMESNPIVLDITHDTNNAFKLNFDDVSWENYIYNLKPLGLNILLNTCNRNTRSAYSAFHCHISHELLTNGNDLVVPVTSRRCLCEVARMIGFGDKATDAFKLEQELCTFRNIESDGISRNKLTKAKIKFAFPHMMSIVAKERVTQSLQLMAQGTGDLILDSCEDFWDGSDLRVLTNNERKVILDFYQRNSLSAICSAFAYKPLTAKISSHLASFYVELNPSKGILPYNLFPQIESLEPVFEKRNSSASTDCLVNLTDIERKKSEKDIADLDGTIDSQNKQIFIGMITMQYQAILSMVRFIEQLDQACIRFVHFSKENELRSRIFSEKMGLESGWNCHISLSGKSDPDEPQECETRNQSDFDQTSSKNLDFRILSEKNTARKEFLRRSTAVYEVNQSEEQNQCLLQRISCSVPAIIALKDDVEHDPTKELRESSCPPRLLPPKRKGSYAKKEKCESIPNSPAESFQVICDSTSPEEIPLLEAENPNKLKIENNPLARLRNEQSLTPTESVTEMYDLVEHPTPLGFDMSNRAKLPKGIQEIRPHLENVDNVPLLVSLFTDCNADNAIEMTKIMQDYGEIVLLIGSVANLENRRLFLQADASIALEPMYPQACQKQECFVHPPEDKLAPTEVAMLFTSLPCSLFFKKNDPVAFHTLITIARHFMNNCVRNCIQFWLCCQLSLTFLGFMSMLMLLPPVFTIGDAMWLSLVIIPVLALMLPFSIMNKIESEVMEIASWKNQCSLDRQTFVYAFWFYGMKFVPSLLNSLFLTAFNLKFICQNLNNTDCSWVYPIFHHKPEERPTHMTHTPQCPSWACENADKLLFVQQFCIFFLVLYFVMISACFVYRSKYLWVQSPVMNKNWSFTCLIVVCIQLIYANVKLRSTKLSIFELLPVFSYVWAFFWIVILLCINELIRRQEIKLNIRFQKRARLDFGTKLGMNSPF